MTNKSMLSAVVILALAAVSQSFADGLPDKQPNLIHIWRESVKPGRAAEHAKNEAGYVAAYEKSKSPANYLGLVSDTGPDEAWYISAWESNASMGEDRKREDKDAALSAELTRLDRIDAEYVNSVKKVIARARPELSVGQFPDLAKARYFQITVYRIRPGHESQFEAAARAYGAAMKRGAPKGSGRVYQVVAGMPVPTFLVISSLEDYADFDQLAANAGAAWNAATPEEQATIGTFAKEAVLEEESNRFHVDPVQSYVSKETRAKDPEFWSPK
jgi:hypothetical protein